MLKKDYEKYLRWQLVGNENFLRNVAKIIKKFSGHEITDNYGIGEQRPEKSLEAICW